MVALSQLVEFAFPQARCGMGGNVAVTDNGQGQRITQWDEAAPGPVPEWDEATGTYPALEAHRTAAEAAASLPPMRKASRSQMAADFAALPLSVRQSFAGLYIRAERFLDLNDWELAIAMVAAEAVPPELESVRAGFLEKLNAGKH